MWLQLGAGMHSPASLTDGHSASAETSSDWSVTADHRAFRRLLVLLQSYLKSLFLQAKYSHEVLVTVFNSLHPSSGLSMLIRMLNVINILKVSDNSKYNMV